MNTEDIFGTNASLLDYLLVLFIYLLMLLLIKYPKPVIELNYRINFIFLAIFWAIFMFIGNYVGYKMGLMSFLPWLNNSIHTFIWVGLGLNWLYYSALERPVWEQVIFCVFTSFIVKVSEHLLLGTWSMDSYMGIQNPYAYIIAMSLVDGLYPIISLSILKKLGGNGTWGLYYKAVNG